MNLQMFNLEGKTAIVTGASTGIGEAIAQSLAIAGANIVGVARSSCANAKAKVEKEGREFLEINEDLISIKPVQSIIDRAVNHFGHVDILVNNAGIIRREDALEFSEQDWDDVMNVNLKSLFFLSKAAAAQFVSQGSGGKIINIASLLSYQGGIRVASYTASKSGVMGLTMLLSNELAAKGINVNAIAPGYIETNNPTALRSDKNRYESILERIPAKRWGKPEDLGGAAVFLASDASAYINGFTLAVDGGWLGR